MDLVEIYELTAKAFETNHVKELLLGEGKWKIPYGNRFASGNKPTDWDRLVTYAIIPYCRSDKTGESTNLFQMAIKSLIAVNTPLVIWSVFEIYSAYCYAIRSNNSESLFTPEIKQLLANAIKANINELTKCKEWDGGLFEDGLWAAISGSNKFLESKFGMGIL